MFNKLQQTLKQCLLAGEKESVDTLRMFKSEVLLEAKSLGQAEPSDEVVLKVLRNQIKLRQDAIQIYRKAGASSSEHKEESELKLLESFLPRQLATDELEDIVMRQIKASGVELHTRNLGTLINLIADEVGQSASRSEIAKVLQQKNESGLNN